MWPVGANPMTWTRSRPMRTWSTRWRGRLRKRAMSEVVEVASGAYAVASGDAKSGIPTATSWAVRSRSGAAMARGSHGCAWPSWSPPGRASWSSLLDRAHTRGGGAMTYVPVRPDRHDPLCSRALGGAEIDLNCSRCVALQIRLEELRPRTTTPPPPTRASRWPTSEPSLSIRRRYRCHNHDGRGVRGMCAASWAGLPRLP